VRAERYRAVGAYLGLAVGDALGATVEFMTPREIQARHGVHKDIAGGGWLNLKPGQVTDDTEMSLALGSSILENGGLSARAAAKAFSDWMASKPVDMGHTVRRGVARFRRTGETEVPESETDGGNGACMRTLPVALAGLGAPPADVDEAVKLQAHITHNNPLSDAGTSCVVRMVQAAIFGVAKVGRLRPHADTLARKRAAFAFDGRREENPSGFIVHTLRAVFQAMFAHDDFEAIMIDVVNRGGDADTTGAIAGMIVGAVYGPDEIPVRWLAALDPQVFRACEEQAIGLIERSPFAQGTGEAVVAFPG
jgi:ADP-ribosyl-[dinitrogen reductase] hydrolase